MTIAKKPSIIFDIDGTLADTKAVDDKCFIEAFLDTFSIDLQQQDWAALQNVTDWGITEEIIQQHFNRSPSQSEYQQMKSRLFALLEKERVRAPQQFLPVKGAIDFFDYLNNQTEHRLGIATGAWGQSARIKLQGIGLNHHNIAFSNADFFKSREDIVRHSIRQIEEASGEKTQEIIYFGDGAWDYTTCKNLGIRFIGIDILGDGKLKKMGAELVFRDFTAVNAILKHI